VTDELARFGALYGDETAEIVWAASLTMLEQAAKRAGEGTWGRWRNFPRGELRRLRRDVARALELARLAVALEAEADAAGADLAEELHRAARAAAARAGRERTLDAEYVRVAKAAARRAGVELNRYDSAELERWGGPRSDFYTAALARFEARD
jgi:hypothetical protein